MLAVNMYGSDDLTAAQTNQYPYSEWDAYVNYSDDCSLGITTLDEKVFSIFPNPVKNELTILSNKEKENLKIKIFNIQGKLLNTQNLDFEKQASINVSSLANGIYFLNIEDENGSVKVKKFIKE